MKQKLRDKIYDEITLWLAKGYGLEDSYKIKRLVTSIAELLEEDLAQEQKEEGKQE